MIDDDGVVVTESGALLLYLARKSGKLMPRDLAGEAQVLRWCVAALNTIEVPMLAAWFVDLNDGNGTKPGAALHQCSDMRLRQLDGWRKSLRRARAAKLLLIQLEHQVRRMTVGGQLA
jgi:glutathione S-transferase